MTSKKEDEEKRVVELRKQGKTYREIMKELNLSPGRISSILRKSNGQEETKPVSVDTQARRLFSQGKTPLEVANELDLSVEETERIQRDFWKLKGLYDIDAAYEEVIKRDVPSFLTFYRIIKETGMDEKTYLDNSEGSVDDALIKNYNQTHYEQILDTADMLYDKILKRVQNHTSRSSQKTQCD